MNEQKIIAEIQKLLGKSGITVNGPHRSDIHIKSEFIEKFYHRILQDGPSLGLGESYMDGWWDSATPDLIDELFVRIFNADLDKQSLSWQVIPMYVQSILFNRQNRSGSQEVAKRHYNLSIELYESFLDKNKQYTCGYWDEKTETLDEAQIKKLHLICRKLQLKKGDCVLDIGCGWGNFAKFAAEEYGCEVVGITLSTVQAGFAKELCKGLPVEIKVMDYRDLKRFQYDKILICGMSEHVGHKNYYTLMRKVHESLKDGGLFLLHTIGSIESVTHTDPWIDKYIFPNSMLPSLKQLMKASEEFFVPEDVHNFGSHYDNTLIAWYKNFVSNWGPQIPEYKFGNRFYRMMKYYFLVCAASFRARRNQLYQIVFTKNPTKVYTAVR